jgi:RNA polymerase sigma-70 factor (ECF subfamily)
MNTSERDALERSIRERCDAKDYDTAATLAIKGYGGEIYGFLVGLHHDHDEDAASDVFAVVCENLWRGLPRFAWGSTLRTWVYTIARHASLRHRKSAQRRARGAVPIGEHASRLAAEVRTATQTFLKTAQKDGFARLRESLPPEDQILLVLRVDRDLAWGDLARIMLGDGEEVEEVEEGGEAEKSSARATPDDEETLKREAARLRKRFQLLKEKLFEMGKREGLIHPKG